MPPILQVVRDLHRVACLSGSVYHLAPRHTPQATVHYPRAQLGREPCHRRPVGSPNQVVHLHPIRQAMVRFLQVRQELVAVLTRASRVDSHSRLAHQHRIQRVTAQSYRDRLGLEVHHP